MTLASTSEGQKTTWVKGKTADTFDTRLSGSPQLSALVSDREKEICQPTKTKPRRTETTANKNGRGGVPSEEPYVLR